MYSDTIERMLQYGMSGEAMPGKVFHQRLDAGDGRCQMVPIAGLASLALVVGQAIQMCWFLDDLAQPPAPLVPSHLRVLVQQSHDVSGCVKRQWPIHQGVRDRVLVCIKTDVRLLCGRDTKALSCVERMQRQRQQMAAFLLKGSIYPSALRVARDLPPVGDITDPGADLFVQIGHVAKAPGWPE